MLIWLKFDFRTRAYKTRHLAFNPNPKNTNKPPPSASFTSSRHRSPCWRSRGLRAQVDRDTYTCYVATENINTTPDVGRRGSLEKPPRPVTIVVFVTDA